MWDVTKLKRIDEFENLDFWTLMKIAEIANRDDEYQRDLEEQHEELKSQVSELEDEVCGLEDSNEELKDTVADLNDLLRLCYLADDMEQVKYFIEDYDSKHPYREHYWPWIKSNE